MQLATANNNQPWVCTVNYVFDNSWNLYWFSLRSRRHSTELQKNPKTAITIVKDSWIKCAIQMEGTAREVEHTDLDRIHDLYSRQYEDKQKRLDEAKSGRLDARTYYVFKPTKIILFDEINFPDHPSQEYKIE